MIRSQDWLEPALTSIASRVDLAARLARATFENKLDDGTNGGHPFVNLADIKDTGARDLIKQLIADFAGNSDAGNDVS